MNWRWLWFDHFPAGLALSRDERKGVRRCARQLRHLDPSYERAERRFQIVYLPVAVSGMWGVLYLGASGGWGSAVNLGALFSYMAACSITGAYAYYRTHAPFIRRALHEYGHEVCIHCGYLLRGLGEGAARCPECGADRDAELMRLARENDLPPENVRREGRPARLVLGPVREAKQ